MTNRTKALLLGLALYLVWIAATYLLEGRIRTLLRPDATLDRLTYALVANLLVGIGGAALVLRRAIAWQAITPEQAGFRSARRTAIGILVGALLGALFFLRQGAPTLHPMVLADAFAQVLVVSVAEVLVCWSISSTSPPATCTPRSPSTTS